MPTLPIETDAHAHASEPFSPLRIFIAYDDAEAYRRAIRMLANTFHGDSAAADVQPLPWRFDEAVIEPFRWRAKADATRAEVFVISVSNEETLPDNATAWLDESFGLRRDRATAVLTLQPRAARTQPSSAFRESVRRAAQNAGLDFLTAEEPQLANAV